MEKYRTYLSKLTDAITTANRSRISRSFYNWHGSMFTLWKRKWVFRL